MSECLVHSAGVHPEDVTYPLQTLRSDPPCDVKGPGLLARLLVWSLVCDPDHHQTVHSVDNDKRAGASSGATPHNRRLVRAPRYLIVQTLSISVPSQKTYGFFSWDPTFCLLRVSLSAVDSW